MFQGVIGTEHEGIANTGWFTSPYMVWWEAEFACYYKN